ncbi:MAG: phosphoribosylanthranilate isomerase [Bacillota bacterium]
MTVRVKICGIQDIETAYAAVDAGADALGFVFAPSRRRVAPETARKIIINLPPFVTTVGVFVNAPLEVVREAAAFSRLDAVQLHGVETPAYCKQLDLRVIKAFGMRNNAAQVDAGQGLTVLSEDAFQLVDAYQVSAILLDTYVPGMSGGTGKAFNWKALEGKEFCTKIILAGGLNPENVASAVKTVKPYAVDVSSGVETDGRKDKDKIREFITQAKRKF